MHGVVEILPRTATAFCTARVTNAKHRASQPVTTSLGLIHAAALLHSTLCNHARKMYRRKLSEACATRKRPEPYCSKIETL